MGWLVFLLLAAIGVYLIAFLFLVVAAFRVNLWWGFGTLLLFPFRLAFVIVHWQEARGRYLAMVFSGAAAFGIGFALCQTDPHSPFVEGFKQGFAATYWGRVQPRSEAAATPQVPRVAHDLADPATGSSAPAARPLPAPVDPFATQRAACAKHAADLSTLYAELSKARAKLKKGSPAVAAFNAKAAKYQEGLRTLAAEQAQLDALDHPAAAVAAAAKTAPAAGDSKEAEANAALARLRALAAQGDYAAFADTLKKCLADYQGTAAFPQIAATARGTLANVTPDKLTAAIQAQGTAARTEIDAAMGRVRSLVNQTPPTVPKPPASAEVYHYGYHPGALTPDYAHADLFSTRELWNGDYAYMDTAPGVYYRSADCEFNPQTKFFITNRNVPTKKLTDAEITEIVRLYRVIAADQQMLAALPQRLHDAQGASADLLALNKQLAASR